MDIESNAKKIHRQKQSGPKALKKKEKKVDSSTKKRQHNPKAFAIQNVNKAARLFRRGKDIETKKLHVPKIDESSENLPPIIVAIIGPPKVGKSTLLRCLIKNFTRQNVIDIKGPITVVTGKKRRITFIECKNDINCMIDLAKICDLALLLIDASYGFEMEIFEFINICQVHGFPKIMGILTHLDSFKQANTLRKTKKRLKHRFWTEIYPGAKLFYLSGLKKNDYLKVEIHNLGRFLQVMKMQSIEWRTSHPYILVDRYEDITDPQLIDTNPNCNRTLTFYGYVQGAPLKFNSDIHLIGVGDFTLDTITRLEDPCPLPYVETPSLEENLNNTEPDGKTSSGPVKKKRRRTLNTKERLLYGPMSGLGGLIYDTDAIYIDLYGGANSRTASKTNDENSGEMHEQNNLENDLENETSLTANKIDPLDVKLQGMGLSLFSSSNILKADQTSQLLNKKSVLSISDGPNADINQNSVEVEMKNIVDNDDDQTLAALEREKDLFENVEITTDSLKNSPHFTNLLQANCQINGMKDANEKNDEEPLFKLRKIGWETRGGPITHRLNPEAIDGFDCSKSVNLALSTPMIQASLFKQNKMIPHRGGGLNNNYVKVDKNCENQSPKNGSEKTNTFPDWLDIMNQNLLRNHFLKLSYGSFRKMGDNIGDNEKGYGSDNSLQQSDIDSNNSDDDSSKHSSDMEEDGQAPNDEKDVGDEKPTEEPSLQPGEKRKTRRERRMEELLAKKAEQKARFDAIYDRDKNLFYNDMKEQVAEQNTLNKSVFAGLDEDIRCKYEGHRPGMYVRCEISGISPEFINFKDETYPVILGGLASTNEFSHGYIQARVKKHRWVERILKTRDPLVISSGWRRYQTCLVYSQQDHSGRDRMLKYTPKNLHCLATFYGPMCPQNTGILGIQNLSNGVKNFRISLTGVVLNLNKSTNITKKLKLVGEPIKIFKKTAFIKGLFNSSLEAAKFEGALIRTVSGIRGQIKRGLSTPPGAVRCTFEDQITMADIVFIRTWAHVDIPKLYFPVCNLLIPVNDRDHWQGMRTVGQMRYEQGIKANYNTDSVYKDIQRKEYQVKPLVIPPALEKSLPFSERVAMLKAREASTAPEKIVSIKNVPLKVIPSTRRNNQNDDELGEDDNSNVMQQNVDREIKKSFKEIDHLEDDGEIEINRLMKVAQFVHAQKMEKKRQAMVERVTKHKKSMKRLADKQEDSAKKVKKRICRALSMKKKGRQTAN